MYKNGIRAGKTAPFAKLRKRLERDLLAMAARPCAATVFPQETAGCGNNEDLCDPCNAREALRVLQRRVDALKLARAKGKMNIRLCACDR